MDVSVRLQKIISMVKPTDCVADVGCDHGYVPIMLVKRGVCKRAIAADVRKGPLERANMHILQQGLERQIETRLSDGLEKMEANEAECLVMSGIGGLLLTRILSEKEEVAHAFQQLILSPQSDLAHVRKYLAENAFLIERECMIKEDGKFYWIFSVKTEQENAVWSEAEYAYGKRYEQGSLPVIEEFLQKEEKKWSELKEKLINNEHAANAVVEMQERLIWLADRLDAVKLQKTTSLQ